MLTIFLHCSAEKCSSVPVTLFPTSIIHDSVFLRKRSLCLQTKAVIVSMGTRRLFKD
jgi:hypothetical protein